VLLNATNQAQKIILRGKNHFWCCI